MIHVHSEALSVDGTGNPLTVSDTVASSFPVMHIKRDPQHDEENSTTTNTCIPHLTVNAESTSQPSNSVTNLPSIPASCIVGIIASEQRELCAVIDSKSHAQTGTSPPELCVEWTTPGVYECQWKNCNQNFATVDGLVMHINSEHVHIERPDVDYRCQWRGCVRQGKGFNARYKMLIHLRTHTQERPHKCPICYKCFSRVENLKIHNRSHTGERPYPCPFEGCSKAYSNSSDRFKHIKTHREQRPFICKHPGCIKRYTDPSSLRKHVRIHGHYFHNEDMAAKGPICQSGVSSSHDQIDCNNSNSNTSNISVDNCLSSSDTDLVTTPRPTGTGSNEIATRLLPCSSALATVIIPLSSASTPTSIEFSPGTTAIFTVPQRILHFPGQGSVSCFEYSAVSCDTVSSHISGCDVEGIGILPSTHNLPVELSTATQCRSTQTEVLTGVSGGTGTILSCLPTSDLALRSEAMLPTPTLGDDEVSPENIIHVQTSSESPETVNTNEQHPLDLSTSPISHHPPISLANLHADEIDSSGDNSLSSSLGENGKWELPNLNPD